jgi:hemolysin activation/secretion protein
MKLLASFSQSITSNYRFPPFQHVNLQFTKYYSISSVIIGFNAQFEKQLGVAPYYKMPKIGGSSKLRGFHENRYLGTDVLLIQTESKIPTRVYKTFVTFFCGTGLVGDNKIHLFENGLLTAFGSGFNIPVSKDNQIIRIDYALNNFGESSVYLGFGSTF